MIQVMKKAHATLEYPIGVKQPDEMPTDETSVYFYDSALPHAAPVSLNFIPSDRDRVLFGKARYTFRDKNSEWLFIPPKQPKCTRGACISPK